ncbi:MAG: D-alanyl-D-alanine carboxypeptidase family protein [Bacillota bacterium]
MKKLAFTVLLSFCLLLGLPFAAYALEIDATSAILIDFATGKVLYEQKSNKQVPPGAITQILTALVALEKGDMSKEVIIPDDFISANQGDAGISLAPKEKVVLEDMMYALLMNSANDAAQAIAIGVAGSEEEFVKLMNQKSQELGLTSSHWYNVHGLYQAGHASTASDLAIITREALKYDLFNKIITTQKKEIPWDDNGFNHILNNRNQFLSFYDKADGVKTGAISEVGSSLVGSASANGLRLIGVVLNADGMYKQMSKMMDYGFKNFSSYQLGKAGDILGALKVKAGKINEVPVMLPKNTYIITNKGAKVEANYNLSLPEYVKAPVVKGQVLGTATYTDGSGNTITVDIVAANNVDKYTFAIVANSVFDRIFGVLVN